MSRFATSVETPRAWVLAPAQFFVLAAANLFGLWAILGTGAAVRLTDSGLGCRHWPGCEKGHPLPAKGYHSYVEFGNRMVGGVVIAITLLTWLGAWRTPALPRWAVRLALALFIGALAQAPLGYLAVRSDLRWPVVTAHLEVRRPPRCAARAEATSLRSFRASSVGSLPFSSVPASCSSSAARSRLRRGHTPAAASTSTASRR